MDTSAEVVIGVDVGTTDTKALAVSLRGETWGMGRRPTDWDTSGGGAQIAPGRLLDGVVLACLEALGQAAERHGCPLRTAGIGITGMAEAGVLLRGSGADPRPVIAWFDPRGAREVAALDTAFAEDFPARTGLPLTPLPTFAKLLWLTRTQGVTLDGARWLGVPEYIAHALGGAQTSEPSLASRTGLLDQDTLTPYAAALTQLDTTLDLLPPLTPAGTPLGRVPAAFPPPLRDAVVTVAGHDHPVASLAAGALGTDDLFDSCGTAEAFVRITERVITRAERVALSRIHLTQGAHVLGGRRILLGGTKGGLLLRRVLALLGADTAAARAELDAACPTGDVDLPVQVHGGGMDDPDVHVRTFDDGVTPPLVWRAALDAVSALGTELVASLDRTVGPAGHLVAAGGWTRLSSFRAVKRRAFPTITFSEIAEPGALGAAAIAASAAADRSPDDLHRFIGTFLAPPHLPAR